MNEAFSLTKAERERRLDNIAIQETSLRKMALEQFSVSLMNNTKWREVMDALEAVKPDGFRIKFIDEETVWNLRWLISPSPDYIEGNACGPVLFAAIEWLEILFAKTPAGEMDREELRRRFQAQNIPFAEETDKFLIVGYSHDSGKARP